MDTQHLVLNEAIARILDDAIEFDVTRRPPTPPPSSPTSPVSIVHTPPPQQVIRRNVEHNLLFKTKRCRRLGCKGVNCPYVHPGERVRRRPERIAIDQKVAAEMRRLSVLS